MKNLLSVILLFISITVQAQFAGLLASSKSGGGSLENPVYVFDGGATSYFLDEAVSPTMLDGVADPQTWVVRMKIDVTTDVSQGIIGTADGFTQSLKWEIDAGDLTKFDFSLRDGGTSVSMINKVWGADTGWNTYFWTYDTTSGQEIVKNVVSFGTATGTTFTSRTAGREFAVGASAIPATIQLFIGQISDVQLYDRVLTVAEMGALTSNMLNTPADLVLNFAGDKTATVWTDEVSGHEITNQGGVTMLGGIAPQYYYFDRSANAFLTTDMVLDGEQDNTVVYRGILLPNGGAESRIFGFDDSHTDFFLVWDDDKANEFTAQWNDGSAVSNIYESWATDSEVHTFVVITEVAVGVRMYIDGIEVYSAADTDFGGWTTTGNVQLGTKNSSSAATNGLLGTMDRFQIYDRALTLAEVESLQGDISIVTSGKLADFGDNKTSTIWTDDVSSYEATNEGDVVLFGGGLFDSDYQSVLDIAVAQGYTLPSAGQRIIQNQLILDLKTEGIFETFDLFYLPANDGSKEFGQLNWVTPESFELTEVGTVTFASNKGFKQSTTASYYKTGWTADVNGINTTLNSANGSAYSYSPTSYTTDFQYYFGAEHTATHSLSLMYDYVDVMTQGRANTSGWVGGGTPYNVAGMYSINRDDSSNQEIFIDGVQEDSDADASNTLSSSEMYLLGVNISDTYTHYSDAGISSFSIGGSLDAEALTYNNIMEDYYYRYNDGYLQTNAASTWDEAATTTNWVAERLGSVAVESTDVYHGTSAIKVTSGAQTYSNAYIDITGLENGATYAIKIWAKSGTYNASSPQQIYLDDASGWATGDVEVSVTTSTWTEYTIEKATSATTARVYLRANRGTGTAGQTIFGDRITLVKID